MRRHDLLRVDPPVWRAMLDDHPTLASLELVADWAARDWPVIVRRPASGEADRAMTVGLPLPPSHGKRRLGFGFGSDRGLTARPGVTLRDAGRAAPAWWQPTVAALLDLGEDLGLTPRVFGALLWEHATGMAYLTERSDLDLLWEVSDRDTTRELLAGLRRLDATGRVRLDGELVFPDGGGVNWRELAVWSEGGHGDVLVKSMRGVAVRDSDAMFARASAS